MANIFFGIKKGLKKMSKDTLNPTGTLFSTLSDTLATGEKYSFESTVGRVVYGVNVASH